MKSIYLFSFFVLALLQAQSVQANPIVLRENLLYAAKNSTEAILDFDFHVEYSGRDGGLEAARSAIDDQVQYLYGPVSVEKYYAIPKNKYSISKIKVASRGGNRWRASYHYSGTFAVKNGIEDEYPVTLPLNPTKIFNDSLQANGHNPCTDDHYQSEGDFWYFWDPHRNAACEKLLKEGVNYFVVQAKMKRIPNTVESYPEYSRLVRTDAEGKKTIRMDVLFGMDDPESGRDPMRSKDINADSFRSLLDLLVKKHHFKVGDPWSAAEIRNFIKRPNDEYRDPYVIELSRETDARITLQVRMFFGPSGINQDALPFHYFLKDAIETASVFVYSGHSGLGGHLNIPSIESLRRFRIKFDKSNYQIFFQNGCTSYAYYNDTYFARKFSERDVKGTKNLDIVTNGLETLFAVIDTSDFYLLDAVALWAEGKGALSYQRLSTLSDSKNLYGVNGDEDNPKSEDDARVRPPR